MKVLLIVTDLEIGGTPLQVYRLAKGLRRLGVDVSVCCLAGEGKVAELLRDSSIPVYPLGAKNVFDIRILYKFAKLLSVLKPDIVHSFLMHSNIVTRLIGRVVVSGKVVSTICTVEREKRWHMIMENFTHRLADVVVCISQAVMKHCITAGHISKSKLKLIYPGIDVDRIRLAKPADAKALNLDECRNRICFLGRCDPIKRIDLILYALEHIRNNYPDLDVKLIVIGDGPERANLQNLANRLGIADMVNFLGFRDDYPSILKLCKVYVLASEQEGWGVASAEAIVAGLVPVVSDVDGSREVIAGVCGLTFPRGDWQTLAERIVEAIKLYDEKNEVSDDKLAFFDYHRESAEYFELYKTLLSGCAK